MFTRKMLRSFLFAFLLIANCQKATAQFKVFDVVGDSISAGVNPDEIGNAGWVHLLFGEYGSQRMIDELFTGIQKNNSAVSGSTAEKWADEAEGLMDALLNRQPELVVVMIGGNDYILYGMDGDMTAAEFAIFRQNVSAIIDRLQALNPTPQILLVNYYDLFDGLSQNLPSIYSVYSGMSQDVVTGNQILAEVAEEKGCIYVDGVYDDFMHHCYGAALGDNAHLQPDYVNLPIIPNFDIHPVTAGHEVIYQNVYNALRKLANSYRTSAKKSWWLYQ